MLLNNPSEMGQEWCGKRKLNLCYFEHLNEHLHNFDFSKKKTQLLKTDHIKSKLLHKFEFLMLRTVIWSRLIYRQLFIKKRKKTNHDILLSYKQKSLAKRF